MKPFRLRRIKSLALRIHPPLPPSATQSNELLEQLKESYRHKLDQAHPLPTSLDNHLDRILSNPLLTAKVTRSVKPNDAVNGFTNEFTARAIQGTATPETASEYLSRAVGLLYEHYARTPTTLKNALKESQAGSRVLEYLWSQGLNTLEVLSKHRLLTPNLVKCMIAEGRHDVLEHWLFSTEDTNSSISRNLRRAMIQMCIEAEAYFGTSSSNFLRRVKHEFEKLSHCGSSPVATQDALYSAGKLLSKYLIFSERESSRGQIAQEFRQVLLMSVSKWGQGNGWNRAILEFYCPELPDLSKAIAFIKQKNVCLSTDSQSWSRLAVEFCLDCFDLLFQQHRYDDCEQVLSCVKINGADWLGAPTMQGSVLGRKQLKVWTERYHSYLKQQKRYEECQKALDITMKGRGKSIQQPDRLGQRISGSEQDGKSDQSTSGKEKLNLQLLNDLGLV